MIINFVYLFYVDMGSLVFQIGLGHMTDDSMVIGQAVITNLSGLSVTNPLKGYEDISVLLAKFYILIVIIRRS